MKKKILLSVVIAIVALLAFSSVAFAADPVVDVSIDTPAGDVTVITSGVDTSAWHPGSIGQTNTFHAVGGFTADYSAYAGAYGSLGTYVNASGAYGTGATFTMTDFQDFNVLSANHINDVTSLFTAVASNDDNSVAMNLKSIGSMYVWSEATNPYSQPGLLGSYAAKESRAFVDGTLTAYLQQWVDTDGLATMSNSNIWGWGINENGTLSTNYGGGVRNISATGSGEFVLNGAGSDSLTANTSWTAGNGNGTLSVSAPLGGTLSYLVNFVNGLTGTYSMSAK